MNNSADAGTTRACDLKIQSAERQKDDDGKRRCLHQKYMHTLRS